MQNLPKWLVVLVGSLLAVFLFLVVIDKAYQVNQTLTHKNPKNTISVSAEGRVKAVPDLATVTAGVITQGATAKAVQDENTAKVNKIIDFLKTQGVSKEDITTSQFNIYPQQKYEDGKNAIVGYQANQTVTIKIRGVDKSTERLGKILDGVTSNGANEINGAYFSIEDPNELLQQAREEAIKKAKEKGQQLAEVAGLKLGRVISVSESGGGFPVPYYGAMEGIGGGGGGLKAVAPNIEPGSQDITAQMTVVFEVK